MVDGDFTLWESNAILQYLAGKTANTLWPDDARLRADIARWQFWQIAHWSAEACGPLLFQRVIKPIANLGPTDEAVVAKALESFNKEAAMLDAHLGKQPYLVGKDLTIADFTVAAPVFYAERAQFPLAPYSHIRDWFGRVSALRCWSETAPQMREAA